MDFAIGIVPIEHIRITDVQSERDPKRHGLALQGTKRVWQYVHGRSHLRACNRRRSVINLVGMIVLIRLESAIPSYSLLFKLECMRCALWPTL